MIGGADALGRARRGRVHASGIRGLANAVVVTFIATSDARANLRAKGLNIGMSERVMKKARSFEPGSL
jgi:hypothetical protein